MAKSKAQTHKKNMDTNCHIPGLGQAFSYVKQICIKPGIIANLTSYLYDSRIKFH